MIGGSTIKNKIIITIICIIGMLLVGCTKSSEVTIKDSAFLMDTYMSIQIWGDKKTANKEVLDECFNIISNIDYNMSLNHEDSELVLINNSKKEMNISKDMLKVLEKSIYYGDLSDGKFDITMEPVIKLWNIDDENSYVPKKEEINSVISKVDYKNIVINKEKSSVKLLNDSKIYLGAIAKGYSGELVKNYLIEKGIKKAIINLGGNVIAIGDKDGKPFKIGVRDPFGAQNEYFGIASVKNKSVVTSGIYERNFVKEGITYHHILDSKTGYPVNNGVASATVICDNSFDADALSTVLFMLGEEEGIKLCNEIKNVECIFVTKDKEIYMSDKMKEYFNVTKEL